MFIDESVMQGGTFIAILESGDRKERPAVWAAFFISRAFSGASERGISSRWAAGDGKFNRWWIPQHDVAKGGDVRS